MNKIDVCLKRCLGYETSLLLPLVQQQLDILGVPSGLFGKKILLKPNLLSANAPALSCSNPYFVASVATAFRNRGARLVLGDSPAFGSARQVLKRQGFLGALAGLDMEYLSFRKGVTKRLECGIRVQVASEALDCDYFVNLPRIKAHDQMGLTMAVKNVFGIVLGARKAWLHMRHGTCHEQFAQMILDLQGLLPETLVVADGIEVMSTRGPMKGDSLMLGCLAASRNAVALDLALLKLLEVAPAQIPLALVAEKLKCPGSAMGDLRFRQGQPEDFWGSGFVLPGTLTSIRFQPLRYLFSSLKRLVSL